VPDLSGPGLLERGASHFQGGCAPCHGAPGQPANPIVRTMLPEPSDLVALAPTWKPNELFWIVRNGLKYTGMPAWPALEREDEVWALVAFLRALPDMDADRYRVLSSVEPRVREVSDRLLAQGGSADTGLASCVRCHGLHGAGRGSGAFPRLDILSADYLFDQLQAYASGRRHSGFMQPVAAELEPAEMRRLADYYARHRPQQATKGTRPDAATAELGRKLVEEGLAEHGLPSCNSCHGDDEAARNRFYPTLAGQYAGYTADQLRLFKAGKRRGTPAAEIMSVIAQRMTEAQIDGAATWLGSLSPVTGSHAR
jgi:cytochrome c553